MQEFKQALHHLLAVEEEMKANGADEKDLADMRRLRRNVGGLMIDFHDRGVIGDALSTPQKHAEPQSKRRKVYITTLEKDLQRRLSEQERANVASTLKAWRLEKRMTIHEVAIAISGQPKKEAELKRLSTLEARISFYENSKVLPKLSVLTSLGQVYNLTPQQIIAGYKPPPKTK